MATNSLTNVLDKILAQGLSTLREAAIMARLTNADYNGAAATKGQTIDIPMPKAQSVSDVTAAPTHSSAAGVTPGLVQISLSNWKMTDFFLTDKEMVEIDRNRHFVPMQTSEAARAMANNIDTAIMNNYTGVYGYVGTAGTTPFSSVATAANTRKVLNEQLAPMMDRNMVLDPDAEAQALQLSAFSDLEKTGDRAVKIEGELGRKFGFDYFMSQNIVTHTAGTAAATGGLVISTIAADSSTIWLKASSGAGALGGTIKVGDIFTIAGDSQTYTSKSSVTLTSAGSLAVNISPGLATAASTGAAVDVKATHVVNLGFQRNAFAWATRPLMEATGDLNSNPTRSMTDPVSGVTLRVEVVRQFKQNAWQFDFLYGTKLVRPELATRVAG